ncbi:MAG: glycosyltransferase [Methylococcaceae bacterium]|nr:glycosyltransferase [Methylococcaceae bacterium]
MGDFFLPQCIRYRIEQKLEQLSFAGYEASAVSWTLPEKIFQALAFHDVIIFYRTPALPEIVRSIVHARALGKLTFYEIDDLLFEPIYPPPIQSYGSYVSPDSYAGLLKGMALYNNAAKLCEFGIASTQPLVERLSKYVESGICYMHRNGLDSQNSYSNHRSPDKTYVDIFYGSGTQAHNSDFIDIALPALTFILQKHSHVRLIIVGYLELPAEFAEKYSPQLVQIPIVKSLPSYWSLLSNADINIAVLNRDDINDCKSELKWFEAACFGIPSVVSKTTNYEDVIKQNYDGIMVETTDEWIAAFDRLITDSNKRTEIGSYAYTRVRRDYAIEKLSANLETIIQSALSSKLH